MPNPDPARLPFAVTTPFPIASLRPARQRHRPAWTLDRLVRERSIALRCALDKSTKATYSSALNTYLNFCKSHDFPIAPTPDTLSFFVVFMSHHVNPTTVDSYLSGICSLLEPHFPDIRAARNSPLVSRTLTGCKRLRGTPTVRKALISRLDLERVIRLYTARTAHDDLLFVAQLLTGFSALLRLGELTVPDNESLRDPRKLSPRHRATVSRDFASFLLPAHKADRFFEGNKILLRRRHDVTDPCRAMTAYLRSRDSLHPYHPQLWLLQNGTPPPRSWFLRRLQAHFPNDVAGQSLRAGGATDLAERGAPPHIIQAAGRWASNTFQIYMRKNPFLLQAMLYPAPTMLLSSHESAQLIPNSGTSR